MLVLGESKGGLEVVTGTILYLDLKLQLYLIQGLPTISNLLCS